MDETRKEGKKEFEPRFTSELFAWGESLMGVLIAFVNVRGVYREGLLDAYAVRNAANGYGLVYASVLLSNDDAFEYLNTLAVALLDLSMYLYGIADLQSRQIALELLLGQDFNEIHFLVFLSS